MLLQWRVSGPASGLRAAQLIAAGHEPTDRLLAEALREPVRRWNEFAANRSEVSSDVWEQLIGFRSLGQSVTESVRGAMVRCGDSTTTDEKAAEELAEQVVRIESAVAAQIPRLEQELTLRVGPLRQLWEARGPGMLRALLNLLSVETTVPSADVIVVQPVRGGGGVAYPVLGSVIIEGLLANPFVELPEVVRLGWLLAQLPSAASNVFAPADSSDRLLIPLALIPAALEAAEFVELASCDVPTMTRAVEAWATEVWLPEDLDASHIAGRLAEWWGSGREDDAAVSRTLGELRRMLA